MKNLKMTIFLGGLVGFGTLTTVALAGHGQEIGEEITVAEAPSWSGGDLDSEFDEETDSVESRQQRRSQRPNRASQGQQGILERITQQLGLSSEQADLMTNGRQSVRTQVQALRTEMRSLRTSTQAMREEGNVGASDIHAMIDRRAELATEIRHLRVDAMLPFQQSLSPEQQELWQQQMRQRRSSRSNGRRGRGQNRTRQQDDSNE
jgi:Spy/CpxP family protein refolding chaperone